MYIFHYDCVVFAYGVRAFLLGLSKGRRAGTASSKARKLVDVVVSLAQVKWTSKQHHMYLGGQIFHDW